MQTEKKTSKKSFSFFFLSGIFSFWQKIWSGWFFSCSKNICKLGGSSSVVFFLYYSLVCRETARDMRLPDSSELLQSPLPPAHRGPMVTLAMENRDPELQLVIFFAQERAVMLLMECFYLIQSYSDEKNILQLVQSMNLFDGLWP